VVHCSKYRPALAPFSGFRFQVSGFFFLLVTRDPAHTRSVGLLIGASLFWSLAGVLFKYVEWPGLAAAAGRGLIAGTFLLVVCWRSLRFTWSPIQFGAATVYAVCTLLFALANKMTTAANAILLQYTAPVWAALLGAWVLHERPTKGDWLTVAVVLGGLSLFLYDGLQLGRMGGVLVALASGVAFAGMPVLLRKQPEGATLEPVILGNFLAAAIGIPSLFSASALPASGWIALFLLGIVQLGFAYLLYARAIRHVTALEAVLIPVLEPVLNPLWVMLALGERPSALALAGGAIVLGAVTARAIFSIRHPRMASS
jgi:drug/metabolite transporter (DMT)-like permease